MGLFKSKKPESPLSVCGRAIEDLNAGNLKKYHSNVSAIMREVGAVKFTFTEISEHIDAALVMLKNADAIAEKNQKAAEKLLNDASFELGNSVFSKEKLGYLVSLAEKMKSIFGWRGLL